MPSAAALSRAVMKILVMKIGINMKYNYLLFALATVALFSCTGKEAVDPESEGELVTIRAYQEGATETRTTLIDGGTQVYWEPSDEIKVFFRGSGSRFLSQNTSNADVAEFSGTMNVVVGINEGASGSNTLWGLYPYRADANSDGESVTTTLPTEQTGRAGSFAKNTNITLAQSNSFDLAFYNVTGGIRFSLTQEGVKEVVFEGLNNEDIAGKVKLAFADGVPVVKEVIEGKKAITLSAPFGQTFETGKWYYIVALPGTLSGGFKMTFNTATQTATLKSSGAKTIKRGIFGSLADADEDLIYKDKGGDEPITGNIVFADPAAKHACVAKFDTNGDGEVSYEEAEAATSFSGLFDNWKTIASFDEIRYFKNVHSLSGVFRGCNMLVSITIPENITDLGNNAFRGCSSLTSVVLPSGITAIGQQTFSNCTSLETVDIPSNVQSIGRSAFWGCSSLTSVVLPSNLTIIENYAFRDCSSLTSFDLPTEITEIRDFTFQNCSSLMSVGIPSNVTSIGYGAFSGCSSLASIELPFQLKTIGKSAFSQCSSLTQIVIPDGVTSLGDYVFEGCLKLTTVNIPSGVTSIPQYCFSHCFSLVSVSVPEGVTSVGDGAFFGVKMWKLALPSSVTSLGRSCFGNIICIILPSASAVAIQSDTFDGVRRIFVPSDLINIYVVMSNWANYASIVFPIDSYKDKSEFTLATSGAVDMGTTVKWAAYNLGATKPQEYGNYYAWGETQTKTDYSRGTYKWCNGNDNTVTKYCPTDKTDYWEGEGSPDGKTVLDLEDDAAHVNWGGTWRMPTDEEWVELMERCYWEWTTFEHVHGNMVYCVESGNSIFLPAAGSRVDTHRYNVTSNGNYWSSSLYTNIPYGAWWVCVSSDGLGRGESSRWFGFSVRPVCAE